MTSNDSSHNATRSAKTPLPEFACPCILSSRLWIMTLALWMGLSLAIPFAYRARVPAPQVGARAPFAASDDYWTFRERAAAARGSIAFLGDSVIWGQYVSDSHTLVAALQNLAPETPFVNLGVNGLHPAALRGLLRYHGRELAGQKVVVFCNLLWMSSPRHDLTLEEPATFNHPDLIPQAFPRVSCYDARPDERISRILTRHTRPLLWARHVRIRYLGNQDLFRWTLENPFAWPSFRVPEEPELAPGVRAVPWSQGGMRPGPMQFVAPEDSFQWAAFLDSLDLLKERGCETLVVMLPFNEHMLTEPGWTRYREFHAHAMETVRKRNLPVVALSVLESELFADASHPMAEGYRRMARELLETPEFRAMIGTSP
ncbi:MAG: hypothetical protein U1E27_09515 [Kiritimatiellia bacterium]|nr:hypothetical protein [Kiritimatiellia bacterium]